jgi:hypothetical protein
MGFSTLLDILGSMIIGGILIMNLLNLSGNAKEFESHTANDKNLQMEVVITANHLEWYFNKIGYLTDSQPMDSNSIAIAEWGSITFLSDIQGNDGVPETITFYVGSTDEMLSTPNPRDRILYRVINGGTPYMVSNNITEFKLGYFDTFRDSIPAPVSNAMLNAISFISISLKVEDPTAYSEDYNEAYWKRLMVTTKKLDRN